MTPTTALILGLALGALPLPFLALYLMDEAKVRWRAGYQNGFKHGMARGITWERDREK